MKREIEAHFELEILTDTFKDFVLPDIGNIVVRVDGNFLVCQFLDSSIVSMERVGEVVNVVLKQKRISSFYHDFMNLSKINGDKSPGDGNHIIPWNSNTDEIMDLVFDYLKRSDTIMELDYSLIDTQYRPIMDMTTMRKFVIIDKISGEEINMLEKHINSDAINAELYIV